MTRLVVDRLTEYREKRTASRTPEPFGGQVLPGGSIFVVQKHAATRLHWDLRLEYDGVLMSWAVPKGPSPNQADKRLAVRTEDHPLEYAEFEGVIPKGEYGAGSMIVWDRGSWVPLKPVGDGMSEGKLLFELRGHKLFGKWTLVKTQQSSNSWLLIKERDSFMDPDGGTEDYPDDSIYSGLTVEELASADAKAGTLARRAAGAGARLGQVRARTLKPMLARPAQTPFSKDGWLFELKYDGYRLLAERRNREPYLRSRAGHDITRTFPEIARAVRGLPFEGLLIDGEVVVNGSEGLPSFARLQRRGRASSPAEALAASYRFPAVCHAFDLLALEGYDLRPLPLQSRKRFLREVLPSVGPIRYADHIEREGAALFERVEEMGLEGIMGKRADSPYREGRSHAWVKLRTERTDDFVVVGWTDPKGTRTGFGALHLASVEGGTLTYRGSVGSGFSEDELDGIVRKLTRLSIPACACTAGEPPRGAQHHWVRPEIVVEVRYRELSESGSARLPVFSRLRPDKEVAECTLEDGAEAEGPGGEPAEYVASPREPNAVADERIVPFTNLDKVFWPEDGYTKGDLIEYHRRVARWMLPYLRDRPLVMTRYPDGIDGKSFYQKDAPKYAPDWFRRLRLWSESSRREISYFVADDLESLLYVINLGTIPIHVWSSRVSTLAYPDWCILDLDPREAPFTDVVAIARAIHDLCDELGLPSFVKTSGSSGIHVLIPLAGRLTYEQSRKLGELLANVVVAELAEIATVARIPEQREGKVYVDFLQNGHGRLLAAPFTARPVPGAPVSVPLQWDEVGEKLSIADHNIANVPERMERLGDDPLRAVLELGSDVGKALDRLRARMAASG